MLNDAIQWNERDMQNLLEHVSKPEGSQFLDGGTSGVEPKPYKANIR
jgi:hypothetical protein